MTANPWHSADSETLKPVSDFLQLISFILPSFLWRGTFLFFFAPRSKRFFFFLPPEPELIISSLFWRLHFSALANHRPSYVSINHVFLWVIRASSLWLWPYAEQCLSSSRCVFYTFQQICTRWPVTSRFGREPWSPVWNPQRAQILGGIGSFSERKKLIAISRDMFFGVFLPPLVTLIT